ncbi:MAG: hypothetical protein ACYC27_06170 [Armatimonadota bacterium]
MKRFICVALCILLSAGIAYCDNDTEKEVKEMSRFINELIAKPLVGIKKFTVVGYYHINDAAKKDKYNYSRVTGRAFVESITKNILVQNDLYTSLEPKIPTLDVSVDCFFTEKNTYVYRVTLCVFGKVILPAEPDKLYWPAIVWSKNTDLKLVTASNQEEFLKKVAPDIKMLTNEFIKSYKIANPVIKKNE